MSVERVVCQEQRYPIWQVFAKWEESGQHNPSYPKGHEGLPEGRIRNSTSFYRMYQEERAPEQVRAEADEWWGEYSRKKLADKNPDNVNIEVKLVRHEVWCLTWFNHWTFDNGQSDAEVLESFERFVQRMEDLNGREGGWEDGFFREPHCLMGAEDRWRWRGRDDKPAPCRCDGCKKLGVIRIDH